MRSKSIIIIFLLTVVNNLYAVPAYPKKTAVIVNGDTLYISLKGDENCKFAIDEQGYTILPTERGWFYAKEDEEGNVALSNYQLMSERRMSSQTKAFLNSTRKGLVPIVRAAITKSNRSANISFAERKPAIGSRKALVILMQFQDTKFTKDKNDFQRLFNEQGYSEDGAKGSVYDYYQWASYGQLYLTSDVYGPYTAQNDMAYYGGNSGVGGNDINPYMLFREALNNLVQETSLSDYDADGDGYVDNIHIIYAGYGEDSGASANAIWSHESTFSTITVQGMKIDRYSCAPELRGNKGVGISRIGPHCHEIGHALGAMDFYDTDYETGGYYQGTGKWDIMASGSWNNDGISPADFNPYVKIYNYGWTDARALIKDAKNVVGISSEKGNIYRLDTGRSDEYFLLENRNQRGFHSAEPGRGLLIFHIGPNLETRASTNTINSTFPQQCYVVCASSTYKRPSTSATSYGNINSAGCPYPGTSQNTEFSDTSTPSALNFNGEKTGINISGIAFEGENIVFQYGNKNTDTPDDPVTPPDDPDTPPDDVYLWGEDFEQLKLPSGWDYTDIEKNGRIEVVTKMSSIDTPSSPNAESGKGYTKFEAIPQMIIGAYRTSGRLLSPQISLLEGKSYEFSFSVRKYNESRSHDIVTVELYNEDGSEVYDLIQKDVENQDAWTRYSVPIPTNFNRFSFGILFDADYGTTMFVDHITILEKPEDSGIQTGVMLVVELNSGATETFSLFDKPELTMAGSRMNVKSASVETSYERSDIKSFYFVNSGTGIEETVEEKVSFKQIATNQFQISGLSDKDRIVVSNLTGQTFGHVVSKDGPDAFVDLDGCPQGVYVIKIGKKQTVKIIKK